MTRLFAALALTSVSIVASAAEKPLPVTVTNTVAIPVVEQPPTLTPGDMFTQRGGGGGAGTGFNGWSAFQTGFVMTSLMAQVLTEGGTGGRCGARLELRDENDQLLIDYLFYAEATPGDSVMSPLIPIPNVAVQPGYRLAFVGSNSTGGTCLVWWVVHGLK